mmetsp:Transcript_18372/g.41829  ORF Transcript_18372/g.41829 Transcript_18372/m.41829 type:complete len:212 (-) Transcript_18372:422-1057(-)
MHVTPRASSLRGLIILLNSFLPPSPPSPPRMLINSLCPALGSLCLDGHRVVHHLLRDNLVVLVHQHVEEGTRRQLDLNPLWAGGRLDRCCVGILLHLHIDICTLAEHRAELVLPAHVLALCNVEVDPLPVVSLVLETCRRVAVNNIVQLLLRQVFDLSLSCGCRIKGVSRLHILSDFLHQPVFLPQRLAQSLRVPCVGIELALSEVCRHEA